MENVPMLSPTSICNQALSWNGEKPVASLDDNSTNAVWLRANYPFFRDAVLEARMWTFATAREVSTVQDTDKWGTQFRHPIPQGWLQVFRVYRDVSGSDPANWCRSDGWRREGQYILANDSTVYLWGVERITDTGKFSQMFAQCLAQRIAAEGALMWTGSRQKQVDAWNLYEAKMMEAATRDGQQGSNERIQSSSLINVRRGGGIR